MSLDDKLGNVIASVFGVSASALSDADSPQTIATWDSVGHLQLMLALEAEFSVQFSPDEIAALTSVGAIRRRLGNTAGA